MRTEAQKLATKELRKLKREQRKFRRINKRKEKDNIYMNIASMHYKDSISWGRHKYNGRIFTCEMNYGSCEERGYCDGDC